VRQPQFSRTSSFGHAIRREPARLLALTGLGLLLVAVFASAATPQGGGTYTPSISPTTATAGVQQVYTVTIANDGSPNTAKLGSAQITLPSGSSHTGTVVVFPPGTKTWSGSISNGVVSLKAEGDQTPNPTNALAPGEAISVNVTATLTVAGPNTWTTDSWEGNDFATGPFLAPGSDPVVTVAPNEPDFIAFVQQPTLTQFNTNISPAVTVKVEDAFGNATPNKPVTITINPSFNPPTPDGILTGGGPTNTDPSGIATFAGLKIDKPAIGYKLDATVPTTYSPPPTRTATSVAFDIANQVSTCADITAVCTATGSTPNRNKATVNAFGLGAGGGALARRLGPAIGAQALFDRIGMTVVGGTGITLPPNTSCGNLAPIGDPFWITTFEADEGDPPSYEVVARLDKSLVKPRNPGAKKYDICLGAINVNAPPPPDALPDSIGNGCTSPSTSNSWKTKDGSCAKFFNGFYWGLVADYPVEQVNKTTGCPGSPGFPTPPPFNLFPGVYKKQKNNVGDIVITFCKPAPWDGGGGWR
jgi:hypothetical protein